MVKVEDKAGKEVYDHTIVSNDKSQTEKPDVLLAVRNEDWKPEKKKKGK